ncbi:MAG TPA: NUDIX hydrolase, partial [Gammaproteobacteria bacterium]|nr:NUDIX hydrolase [Gammaproteobacteria bacterium]
PARLDEGIVAVHWLARSAILGRSARLRSPMVMQCIDDYRAGIRFPLRCLKDLDRTLAARIQLA